MFYWFSFACVVFLVSSFCISLNLSVLIGAMSVFAGLTISLTSRKWSVFSRKGHPPAFGALQFIGDSFCGHNRSPSLAAM
jgi:hypothetical protein